MSSRNGESDVLVIGAGAAGLTATRHLAAAGIKVVCLEQGDRVDPDEFPGGRVEWELMSQKRWHPNPNVRDLEEDYPINTENSDVNPLMYAGVGGSTILYGAQWHRFLPSDFKVKSLDGIADDWPFAYDDLAPFYDQIEREIGVSGLGGDTAYPSGLSYPLPSFPIGKIGHKAASGMNKLGWHWWPASQAMPSRAYAGRNPCARIGTCDTGCPEAAKGSFDRTHLPLAERDGAQVIAKARVKQILINANGQATGAIYVDRTGRERRHNASVVIVCCNGVGTPRLLLMSATGAFSNGLANSSGLVGRRLMMHPFGAVTGTFDEDLESWMGPSGQSIYSMQFYETNLDNGFYRGAKWQVKPAGGPLGTRAHMNGKPLEETWGAEFHRKTKAALGRSFEWGIIAEDLPDDQNAVVLDSDLTDVDGNPCPKINYRSSENTTKLLNFHVDRVKEAMEAAGAVSMVVSPLMRDCGWHLMGTTKMGNDPETSVVDQYGRSHDIANLFVFDGSTFPTSSGVNPTATVAAFALRSVMDLINRRRDQETPK